MKIGNLALLAAAVVAFASVQVAGQAARPSADEILKKASEKLSSLRSISYQYHQEYNYKSEGYLAESKADSYLEFTTSEETLGVRFQFSNSDTFRVFNGSEMFELNKKNKTIRVEPRPGLDGLGRVTFLQFTPLMVRNALPRVIADRTIAKRILDSAADSFVVEFVTDKAFLGSASGEIKPLTTDRKMIYRLTVARDSFMPTEIYRGNSVNDDFNRTRFSEIKLNPSPPVENTWYYSSYLAEYKYAKPPEDNLIKAGETAHALSLPQFPSGTLASLSDYKGKMVLLDFWIVHCGFCQESMPRLDRLEKKYKGKPLKILGINVGDKPGVIRLYAEKTKPRFTILTGGEEIAQKYGVAGYPMVVLIGRDGRVIYSGPFDEVKLDSMIGASLLERSK